MTKVIAIDPGSYKCGLVIARLEQKIVDEAIVLKSDLLINYLKKIFETEDDLEFLIGNGTSSQKFINALDGCVSKLIVVEEKNSTFRAKQRFFEIFPLLGIKALLPREIFILNKNLDALAALIIMEDYYKSKFNISNVVSFRTWLK